MQAISDACATPAPPAEEAATKTPAEPHAVFNNCKLLNFPLEIVNHIIAKLDKHGQFIFRRGSDQMCELYIEYWLHRYRKLVHQHRINRSERSVQLSSILRIAKEALDVYVHSGYKKLLSVFLPEFLSQMAEHHPNHEVIKLTNIVLNFYSAIELMPMSNINEVARLQHIRIIYMISLFNLLRQFRRFRLRTSKIDLMEWQLRIDLGGVYMGTSPELPNYTDEQDYDNHVEFISCICELLHYESMAIDTVHRHMLGNIYGYGLQHKSKILNARLILKFKILASKCIQELLQAAIEGHRDIETAVPMLPPSTFSVNLEINSKNALRRAGLRRWRLTIMPLTEMEGDK